MEQNEFFLHSREEKGFTHLKCYNLSRPDYVLSEEACVSGTKQGFRLCKVQLPIASKFQVPQNGVKQM